MFIQLLIGTVMICLNILVHAVALDVIMRNTRKVEDYIMSLEKSFWKPLAISIIALCVYFAHIVEIWMWAVMYFILDTDVSNFETALYFSTSSFTTVGFGDVVLGPEWRLLSAIESAGGFFLFGWSVAFTFEVLSQLYYKESKTIRE